MEDHHRQRQSGSHGKGGEVIDVMYNRGRLRQSGTILSYSDHPPNKVCRCVVVAKFRRRKNTGDAQSTNS
ncbi:MAG: hypothetical protein F4W68_01535 [Cenarchaeum sp. SB0661_bin_35]|nr:hypothetical protein [Cenarchaeum sp. SB0667_bin_13]MXZ93463.1 hypothetical protein [Cenarchaeum sp. SB0666_bin_15]MYB46276.1 hypothetical protein [Cenarchaeum sp. SB0662_bin_33]MYC79173.1 hypothetical protein [Cenarchaeum sp. SB0661_bin_35]MYD59028.1 hypothetical protein [Cenarchaeum sp. SB0678_bin_8]